MRKDYCKICHILLTHCFLSVIMTYGVTIKKIKEFPAVKVGKEL